MCEDGSASAATSASSPRRRSEREVPSRQSLPAAEAVPAADRLLLAHIHAGDRDAGHRFVQTYYPDVYRYLLYLTGSPETAEDLAQETFLQAWRRLDTFEGRSALRTWLHRIAHREFLHTLRSQREQISLEGVGEIPETSAIGLTETVELRVIIGNLPLAERQVVLLHYLEGYPHEEIAHILRMPLRRVRQRLAAARARLQQELAEGDLLYLNEPSWPMRLWAWLPLDQIYVLATRLTREKAADRGAPPPEGTTEDEMERRDFLRHATIGAAGLMLPEAEKEIVDSRLTQRATLAAKGMALADLCERLREDTGVLLVAGSSVTDEKVTIFCEKLPLREVMRQLSRPFGYTWLRSGTPGQYRYELVQDLRSQLLEEELRNRDRHAAWLSLEKEIQRYRPYLDLSPDEALHRAKTAPEVEKNLLLRVAGSGWGAIQMYFRLTPQQQATLRNGQALTFSQSPKPGEATLPPEIARGVLQSLRDVYFHRYADGFGIGAQSTDPGQESIHPTALPEARATVQLSMRQSELGEISLAYSTGLFSESDLPRNSSIETHEGDGSLAMGISPSASKPDNRAANSRLTRDTFLQKPVTIETIGSCSVLAEEDRAPTPGDRPPTTERRATSADFLEAVHRATGLPVVGDFYTKLYVVETLSARKQPLFVALNQIADPMRLRWSRDGDWLAFRSASYYDDRLKEVPNRLLAKWAASRKQHGWLTLDDLIEIANLSDTQLDASGMAEGARDCWGLVEWKLSATHHLRAPLRFLAELTPAQRQEATNPRGLPFAALSLAQQQGFLAVALRWNQEPVRSLTELEGAALRVDYMQPGRFEWRPPGKDWYQWVVPTVPGQDGQRALMPPSRGRTQGEALAAALRLDTRLLEAILPEAQRLRPEIRTGAQVPDAGTVVPTRLDLTFLHIPGLSNRRDISVLSLRANQLLSTW